jgi:hypothetical protein
VATFAGEVEVTVTPDTSGFGRKLTQAAQPEAARAAERIGKQMGDIIARKISSGIQDGLSSVAAGRAGSAAGSQFGKAFAATANATIKGAVKDVTVKVDADTRAARAEIDAMGKAVAEKLKKQIADGLRDGARDGVDINVDLDAASASVRLQAFAAQCELLERDGVDINVDLDAASAVAGLVAIRAAAGGAGGGMGALVTAAFALGPALVPVAGAAAAALAAVGVAAAGAVAAVAAVGFVIVPVIKAVQALGQAESSAGSSAGSAAAKHLQLAAASEAVDNAQRSLARTIVDAREAEERSAERVEDSRRSLAQAKTDAARDEERAARQVQDAERRLADAQLDFLAAQEAVNEARREAVRDLEDLESRLANASISYEESQLRMREAQEEYQRVLEDGTATESDRARASLNLQRAQQDLTDAEHDLRRANEESNEAFKKGIDGSDRVVGANERLKTSQDGVTEAQRGVADAERDAEERRTEAAKGIAEAQRDLARAVEESAGQQRKSAEAIADAQRGVASAQRGAESASTSAGNAGVASANGVAKALAALSPAGLEFVQFVQESLIPVFGGISKAAQQGMLPGVQKALEGLLPYISDFARFIGGISKAMGGLAVEASAALTGPFWSQFFGFIGTVAAPALVTFSRTIGNLITGFSGLFQAFAPVGMSVGDAFLAMSQRFAEFGRTASSNPAVQAIIRYIKDTGPLVVSTLGAIARAFGNIIQALAPIGPVVLQIITAVANFIAIIPPDVIATIAVAVVSVVAALNLFAVAMAIVNAVMAASPLTLIVVGIGALVAALVVAYNNVEWFRKFWDDSWVTMQTVARFAWESVIQPTWRALTAFIRDVLAPTTMWLWRNIIEPAWRGISTIVQWAWTNVIQPVFRAMDFWVKNVIAPVMKWLWQNVIIPVWHGIANTITWAWSTVIRPLLVGARDYITHVWAPLFSWLWHSVIQPAWTGIRVAINVAWAVIRLILGAIRTYIREVLAPVFTWLRDNVIRPVWNGIASVISAVWTNAIRPVFQTVGSFLEDHVAPAFRRGVDAIRVAWDRVREAAAAPVRFIIDRVIKGGIIGAYNKLAGWFGVDPVEVKLPDGFATGGQIRGPGTGTSDSILARVSAGEYVVKADVVRRLGVDFFDAINATGNVAGDVKSIVGAPRFATGGLVQRVLSWLPTTDPLPYLWGAVGPDAYDCSGLTGEAFNRLTGRPSFRRAFTTSSDFTALGFRRGEGMFTLGLNPSEHVVGRLGALPFEAQSTATGIFVGNGATPVSSMAQQWFLPSIGPGGGDPPGGFDIRHPIASMKRLITAPLRRLSEIEGTPFGALAAHMPRAIADAAVGKLTGALDGLPGFARGGLVSYDQGGWLPQGLSTVVNASGSPEPILTPGQWNALAGTGGQQLVANFNVTNPAPETLSETLTRGTRRLAAHGLIG